MIVADGGAANIICAQIMAPLDVRVCSLDLLVLRCIGRRTHGDDDMLLCGDITLDKLCGWLPKLRKHHVFAAVGRLEEFGLIPESCIR